MDPLVVAVATYALFLVALAAVVAWLRAPRPDRLPFAIEGVVAAALVGVLVKVAGLAWDDPRPFVVDHVKPLIDHGVDNGFPSDHTALAVAVSCVVLTRFRRLGAALVAVTLALGAARVAAGVHHVPDILGGLAIGALAAFVAVLLAPALARRVPATVTRRIGLLRSPAA